MCSALADRYQLRNEVFNVLFLLLDAKRKYSSVGNSGAVQFDHDVGTI